MRSGHQLCMNSTIDVYTTPEHHVPRGQQPHTAFLGWQIFNAASDKSSRLSIAPVLPLKNAGSAGHGVVYQAASEGHKLLRDQLDGLLGSHSPHHCSNHVKLGSSQPAAQPNKPQQPQPAQSSHPASSNAGNSNQQCDMLFVVSATTQPSSGPCNQGNAMGM